jgi:hypothetical protein
MRIFRILADAEGKFIKKKPRAKRFWILGIHKISNDLGFKTPYFIIKHLTPIIKFSWSSKQL